MDQVARISWVPWPRAPFSRASRAPLPSGNATSHLGGPTLVLGSSASLQSSAALATTVFAVYGPVGTGALRFAIAGPILMLLTRPALRGRPRCFWLNVVALGFTLPALNVALYEAIARVPLATVVTLQFLGPLALALATVRRRLDLVWVTAAGSGVALITGGPGGGSTAGVLLALLAAAITMMSLLLSRRLATTSAGLDGIAVAVAVAVAACLMLPAAASAALATDAVNEVALVAAVAVLGLAVPYALEYIALRAVTVKTFSVLLSLDPAIAALAGVVWLGQRLSPFEITGVGLVVLASTGVMATRHRAQ
jgi:inner membrane transporter RhtA